MVEIPRLKGRVTVISPDAQVRVYIPATGAILQGPWCAILNHFELQDALLNTDGFRVEPLEPWGAKEDS